MVKKRRKRTLKIKKKEIFLSRKKEVYPKNLYEAFVKFINMNKKDEEAAETYHEEVYKPLEERFLGNKAPDRMEQCKLAQRLSALKLKKKD